MVSTPTTSERVFQAIRSDILNGQITPGSRLRFIELSARYATSSGVLREVLPRLVEQGLATSQSQLGFRVITLSAENLEQLTEARLAIEPLVFVDSVTHGDIEWESDVVKAHHRLQQTPAWFEDGRINIKWLEFHRRFHDVLLEGCPNPYLIEVAEQLRQRSEVFLCWSFSRMTAQDSDRDAEHDRLMRAAVARDAEAGRIELEHHIRHTRAILIQRFDGRFDMSEQMTDSSTDDELLA